MASVHLSTRPLTFREGWADLAVASLIFPSNRVSPFLLFCEAFVYGPGTATYLLTTVCGRAQPILPRFALAPSQSSLPATKIVANAKPLPGIHFLNASFPSYFYTWLDFRDGVPNLWRNTRETLRSSFSILYIQYIYIYINLCPRREYKAYGISLGRISTTLSF